RVLQHSSSQSAPLMQFMASDGTTELIAITELGNFRLGSTKEIRYYNSLTDSTHYERFAIRWTSSTLQIVTEYTGAGNSPRTMQIVSAGELYLCTEGTTANGWRVS